MKNQLAGRALTAVLLLLCVAIVFIIPAFFTKVLFDNSIFGAKAIVYLCGLFAMFQVVKQHRLHIRFMVLVRRHLGVRSS